MPRLSPRYAGVLPLALPYIVPVLQTSLTVSVYMTVAIAITALLYIIKPVTLDQPSPTSPDQQEGKIVFLLKYSSEELNYNLQNTLVRWADGTNNSYHILVKKTILPSCWSGEVGEG